MKEMHLIPEYVGSFIIAIQTQPGLGIPALNNKQNTENLWHFIAFISLKTLKIKHKSPTPSRAKTQ